MKFKDDSAALRSEFEWKLHPMTRELARRFDEFCRANRFGEAVVTSICREPEFYAENALAQPKFSWHFVSCAVDFRNKHLTQAQQKTCEAWLRAEASGSQWECVLSTHGTAAHWHVAFRDFSRRKEFPPPTPKPTESP